jgi:hypothetical protein
MQNTFHIEKNIKHPFWYRFVNRVSVLNAVLLFSLLGVWSAVQVMPFWLADFDRPQLLYGKIHYARMHPALGRMYVKFNRDDRRTYILWMDQKNADFFRQQIQAGDDLEVVSFVAGNNKAVIAALGGEDWELDVSSMGDYHSRVRSIGGAIAMFWLLWSLYFSYHYILWFRKRSWFKRTLDD